MAGKLRAGVIEAKKVVVDGVDVLKKLNELSSKVEAQEKEINFLKQELETLRKGQSL